MGSSVSTPRSSRGRLNLWPLALIALVFGCALLGDRGIVHMWQLSAQKAELVQELEALEAMNDGLRREISALRSDRHYIERVARTELGMVRDDELVFQFSDRP